MAAMPLTVRLVPTTAVAEEVNELQLIAPDDAIFPDALIPPPTARALPPRDAPASDRLFWMYTLPLVSSRIFSVEDPPVKKKIEPPPTMERSLPVVIKARFAANMPLVVYAEPKAPICMLPVPPLDA